MAKPPYLEEDYMKYYKPKDHHAHKAKSLSFFASIFSLFIYVCVFYTFNLSPYTILNNNVFWFFMSNTLILIIAADYGAFSSSKQKQDFYEEYVKHSQAITRNYVHKCDEQVDKQCIDPKQELGVLGPTPMGSPKKLPQQGGELLEEKKEFISDQNSDQNIPERVLEIVALNQPTKPSKGSNEKRSTLHHLQVDDGYKEEFKENAIPARIYRRSKSDRHNRAKHDVNEEKMNKVQRSETMKVSANVEEENEFSTMSNEELNRRVEEFIQKFNRQIRLQETRNVYQI